MEELKILLDEDFYAKKKEDYSEEDWRKIVKRWIFLDHIVEELLYKKNKIGKITWNRFSRTGWRIYNFNNNNLMMPSKFNELFDIKPVDMKFLISARKKIELELKKVDKSLIKKEYNKLRTLFEDEIKEAD